MTVFLRVIGNLDQYFGGSKFTVKLPEGASLQDFLDAIAMRWGRVLPPQIWDANVNKFKPGVILCDGQNEFTDERIILFNMQEIFLVLPISGG